VGDGLGSFWRYLLTEVERRAGDYGPVLLISWALISLVAAAWSATRSRRARIAASVLVIGGGIGLWVMLPRDPVAYYKFVDEVVANPRPWRGRSLQVHGFVVPGSIEKAPGTNRYRFTIETRPPRAHATLRVHYSGDVPDSFAPNAEGVVNGMLSSDGVLDAFPNGLMMKCPSKN